MKDFATVEHTQYLEGDWFEVVIKERSGVMG